MDWLARAAGIPRRNALLVGLMLFHLAGLRSDRAGLVLCVERCKPFGLGRKAVQRGLGDLESAGLVECREQTDVAQEWTFLPMTDSCDQTVPR